MKKILEESHLGKSVNYKTTYDRDLLQAIPRQFGRDELGFDAASKPFIGVDIWNAYEVSWLNKQGKPEMAMAEFRFDADTQNLIESKSIKLYLNSLNQTAFNDRVEVLKTVQQDFSTLANGKVTVKLFSINDTKQVPIAADCEGVCLDDLAITTDQYDYFPGFLETQENEIFETVHTHLFRSNCPITKQPDWATIVIRYEGRQIQPTGLLKYLISFRQQNEFHEQCVERIFIDILNYCVPAKLTVYARFTRRGGLDINPFRTNYETLNIVNQRNLQQ